MANIINIQEAWAGHSGSEVEAFIKQQLTALFASLGGKFGHVEFNSSTMTITFYDEPGGTALGTVQLGGQVYTIAVACNLAQVFYVLADETQKIMTITPSTTVSSFGSSTQEPFPESYTYTVAVNSGSGYVDRASGTIATGGSASFDVKPYLATGDNYIRVSVTGSTSGQTKTTVFTGTLTTLTMTVNHNWQNVWTQGQDYNITGIRFAGNLYKTLHVSVNDVECTPVEYNPNQSYTTTATYYTIPATAFPSGGSQVVSVKVWMTAQGVSTPVVSYNIMCAASGDTTPLVAINAITPKAYNFTSGTLFSFAVYNANRVTIGLSATLGSSTYNIATAVPEENLESGNQYPFVYSLEVDTGANNEQIGSLGFSAKPYFGSTEGTTATASTIFDNTYSYLATPGYLFYLNAATRSNNTADYQTIVNEAGASANFPATYSGTWTGFSWYNDGWATDPSGYKALAVPAGCSLSVPTLKPLELLPQYDGMTIEFMLQCGSPSDYSEAVFKLATSGANPDGILIYPTKIVVLGNAERNEDYQSINFSENAMTHICVTILKGYEGEPGKNLVSVYVNGISNVCFEFDSLSSFGNGSLYVGQAHTDAYIYKMRVYGSALESGAVFNNFLNCIVDGVEFYRSVLNAKNNVLLGSSVNYDLVKAAGLNTMVVITPNDEQIPDVYHQDAIDGCTVRFEYAGQTSKNATVGNVTMDGQGTTSKKYYRWNLRWKTNDQTTWSYGDGTSGTAGKKGRMINDTNYIIVDRITAKKNVASSPQGHKMGLTGLYNDIYQQLGLDGELPSPESGPSYRVAVYQFPFVGFQYNATNGQYTFIGVYTAGPDKGSKETFGYLSAYTNLMSLEGPNHAPRGTRFLCPWVDVEYNYSDETLTFGGEEGWDCDAIGGGLKTDKAEHAAQILALYESEWRPAYNCVYDNSPYLASYQEVINALDDPNITTLADLLTIANASAVKAGTTNGMIVKNEMIAFYDSSYDLYFYRRSTGKYEKLPNDYTGYKNALTDLTSYLSALGYSTSSPTTAQLIEARGARFKATMGTYFSVNQTLYHYCFCLLYGVTDNFAKNSYPFKFYGYTDTLPDGVSAQAKKWGWRQDDLDSVLMTDNNGTNTKKYSVEHLDTFDNVQIFQGGDSALWMLVKARYGDECRTMMSQISTAATSLATSLGIGGGSEHANLFNLTSYYCWEHSAKYFPATIYEADRRWAYIEPWLLAGQSKPSGGTYPEEYNNVRPLTQALGDQLQGEKLWMQRRIAYIFSKYHIAEFHGTNTGYNAIVFTLATGFDFTLTPAIDLYPVVSLVDDDAQGDRTPAGSSTHVYIGSSGDSNNSIHGGDWLASLGDLHLMRLTNRGGSSSIPFSITGARLQVLKIGHETAWDTTTTGFNATDFGVTSPTLVELDARNTATITNIVNLLGCPRLRIVKFAGSGAAGLYLPVGAKLTEVSFPASANTVFMHSLPFLQASGLTLPTLSAIRSLYINNCANLNPLTIAANILAVSGNTLAYATLIWSGVIAGTAETLKALALLAGSVSFENNNPSTVAGLPDVEGMVQLSTMYIDDLDDLDIVSSEPYQTDYVKALSNLFHTSLYVIYDPDQLYIRFADPNVGSICVTNWSSDGIGVTTGDAAAVTANQFGTTFKGNTQITSFNELRYFTTAGVPIQAFMGCSALTSVTLPDGMTGQVGAASFSYDPALSTINLGSGDPYISNASAPGWIYVSTVLCKSIEQYIGLFRNVTALNYDILFGRDNSVNEVRLFIASTNTEITSVVIPSTVTKICIGTFYKCKRITSVTIPSSVTFIDSYSFYLSGLTSVNIPSSVTTINGSALGGAFEGCTELTSVTLNEGLQTLGARAFSGCTGMTSINIPASVTTISSSAFNNCVALSSVSFAGSNLTTIGQSVFVGCTSLTSIQLPNSVTSIGTAAFQYSGLTSFVFPANCTTLNSSVLQNCFSLLSVNLGGLTTRMEGALYAFSGCNSVRELYLSSIKQYVDVVIQKNGTNYDSSDRVFPANRDPHYVYVNGQEVTNFSYPSEYSVVYGHSFTDWNRIQSVTIPSGITLIGGNAFHRCLALTSVSFPNTLTDIRTEAFRDCTELPAVEIPSSVTFIGIYAFFSCYKLATVIVRATTPPALGSNAFDGNKSGRKIYVPNGTGAAYRAATNWSAYANDIVELDSNGNIPT